MSTFDEVFERIKLATNTRTQVELAEVLDIRQSSISDAKRRDSVPSDWYMKLFEKFGLNPDWLKKGVGPMYLRTEEDGYQPVEGPAAGRVFENPAKFGDPDARSAVVTIHSMQDVEVSDEADEARRFTSVGKLSIPQSFAGATIQIFRVDACSMEPLIKKGAYVGLDTAQTNILSGEIYGVYVPYEGISIKRIFLDAANQRFILRSENPVHPEQYLPMDRCKKDVVGRVVWNLQTM
ncbi:LexA family transcriptional regulator [Halodesulfovibrio aestuarii]|uniref:Helix-turn-helix domain-containing protein n=1 Tax=Halodesulfovibrio aestuarii TaxID=126333 RepID=A0A8G2C9M0_9BACT|nr:LexA family transcriptional regulator [Halodesulfovibrio aestuarii]SHI99207.1 Phage repressor protein C, contains Cro/C1-type HTH and peptisase s24 domains [Halodesulfovibrio aestuarii]